MGNIYDINWKNVGRNLLFWRWRRTNNGSESKLLAYINSIMYSIQVLSNKLLNLQQETVDFLQYTGQHKILEEYLNDKYDVTLRRIYIVENDIEQFDPVIMGLAGEIVPSPVVIGITSDTVTIPIVMALAGEVLVDNNFTVYIPIAIVYDENTLRAQLNNYVLAGKTYNILTY